MKKVFFLAACFMGTTGILFAQSQIKSETNGPINFNTTGNDLQLQDNGNPVTLKFKNATDPGTVLKLNQNGNFLINQKNNQNILFKTNGQENMRITPSGHIGIGLTNPSSMLSVNGVIQSVNGGFMFPDGSVQSSAGITNGASHLEVTDYLKVGNNSLYIGSTDFGGEYEIYVDDDDLHIQSSTASGDFNTILNAGSNNGYVGVGTTVPSAKLDLRLPPLNGAEAGIRITAPALFFGSSGVDNPNLFEVRKTIGFPIPTGFNPHFIVDANGKIGIATNDPGLSMLHVVHDLGINPNTVNMTITTDGSTPNNADIAFRSNTNTSDLLFYDTDLPADNNPDNLSALLRFSNDANGPTMTYQDRGTIIKNQFHIAGDGNVAFGSLSNIAVKTLIRNEEKTVGLCIENIQSANYGYGVKCIVNNNTTKSFAVVDQTDDTDVFRVMGDGVVWCTELNVDIKGDFPDYVFDESYDLMPLDDLKHFIQKEKHLPNIPTASDVAANGIAVSEITVVQTEKIEELTLYILELHDSMKKISEQNTDLQKRIVELESK